MVTNAQQHDRLSLAAFKQAVEGHLGKRLDAAQSQCVEAPPEEHLFLVAGPGSGKTTAITLRILRLIFVDGYEPGSIIATTFTNRAAEELRSRILGWAIRLREGLGGEGALPDRVASFDLNRVVTGTLDSLAEEVLRSFRVADAAPPVVLEQFAADALMTHRALLQDGRFNSRSLRELALRLRNAPNPWGFDVAALRSVCSAARDRVAHDRVDLAAFEMNEAANDRGARRLYELLDSYKSALGEELVLDFAGLELTLLDRLDGGSLADFVSPLRALFVDEYQDTNFLQESIYFSMLRGMAEGASIAVVGDDDQSLYRFRGATVDLFRSFGGRLKEEVGLEATPIYLNSNYRSTPAIVGFADAFVHLDSRYEEARIQEKPDLVPRRAAADYVDHPVLGIFRPTEEEAAKSLAELLDAVFNGDGFAIPGEEQVIRRHPQGTPGDCAILCDSPKEHRYDGSRRLPGLLRDELNALANPISVFNPRGTAFHLVPDVQVLGGLILECIDGEGQIENSIPTLPRVARERLAEWREAARGFTASDPSPSGTLAPFVTNWQQRRAADGRAWPEEIPLAELVYKLATWVPGLISGVEGLVFLEVFARTISESSRVVQPHILTGSEFAEGRIKRLIREIFVPLALGGIDVDEALLETLPGDHVNILSIHQAKGLEYPMVVVDVGCDFPNNRRARFRRYPNRAGEAETMEDYFRRYSELGSPQRSGLDRAFDDLIRQFFVAFTRPQDLLVLIGIGDSENGPLSNVKNVATGWTRNEDAGSLWQRLPQVRYV